MYRLGATLRASCRGFQASAKLLSQADDGVATSMDIRLGLTKKSDIAFKLNWGLIGAGGISSDWSKCLKEVPGASLAGVAARSFESAEKFAVEHGVTKAHRCYEELVNDPDIDIIYVGTKTCMHKEHTLMAIEAGKHVLCEKPLAENAQDAQMMFEAAEKKGVMLLEGMWTRYFPAVEHARQAIDDGKIGDVSLVQADFADKCYAVAFGPMVFGANAGPKAVAAAGDPNGVSGAVLHYDAGCAMMTFPRWDIEFPEVVEILGTKGRITLDNWGHAPTRITIRTIPPVCYDEPQGHSSTSQNGVLPNLEQHQHPVPEPAGYPAPGWHYVNQHGFVYQALAVHRCLAAGLKGCPQYTKEDSMQVMSILDTIEEEMQKEQAILDLYNNIYIYIYNI